MAGTALPITPPLEPMLARLARELPTEEGYVYEPKWDGFRCLAFRDGDDVELWSRNQRPLGRYFPELVEAARRLPTARFVIDGEVVVAGDEGLDFSALLGRLHPAASRVERLRQEAPASLVAFDLVAVDGQDLRDHPFGERRARLQRLLEGAVPPILLTAATGDREVAAGWLDRFDGAGVDGVVAKHRDLTYQPGRRAMLKVKHERTVDCVVGGFRWEVDAPVVASLLLGLYDDEGELQHVGVVASFRRDRRRELVAELAPLAAPIEGHPWERGFNVGGGRLGNLAGAAGRWTPDLHRDWEPLRPDAVCEVAYEQWEGDRFRHAARFRRWRPDRDPGSCTFDQLPEPPALELGELVQPAP